MGSLAHEAPHLPSLVVAEQTHLMVPSYPHWIEAIVEFLRQKAILSGACQETRAGKVMVAMHEALSNAIVHGNLEVSSELKERGDNAFAEALAKRVADPAFSERTVDVLVDCGPEICRWIITDQGRGFNVDAVLARADSDDPEVVLASGRGILIMRSFLDEVRWELGGRRLILGLKRESGSEKRRRPRVSASQSVHVAPLLPDGRVDWDAAYSAVAKDFSEGGVGVLQQRLSQSERVLLGVSVDGRMVYVPAEVKHCRSLSGDLVEIGCKFQAAPAMATGKAAPGDHKLLHGAINDLLTRHQQPFLPKDERRLHSRIVYTERIEVSPAAGGESIVAYARDLSKGGVAFITTSPLPPEITVTLFPQDGGNRLRLLSRVVRCVKVQDGFYDVGARFVRLEK